MRNHPDAAIAVAGARPQGYAHRGQAGNVDTQDEPATHCPSERQNAPCSYAYPRPPAKVGFSERSDHVLEPFDGFGHFPPSSAHIGDK